MAEEKYIIIEGEDVLTRSPHPQIPAPGFWVRGGNLGGLNWSIGIEPITQPVLMVPETYVHDFDEVFAFVPCTNDPTKFDADIELYLGEEEEKYVINKTTIAYVPAGFVHTPLMYHRVGTPFFFTNCVLSSKYTQLRTDEKGETVETAMPPESELQKMREMRGPEGK